MRGWGWEEGGAALGSCSEYRGRPPAGCCLLLVFLNAGKVWVEYPPPGRWRRLPQPAPQSGVSLGSSP